MNSAPPPAAETLAIENGSLLVFTAVLMPVMDVASRLQDRMRDAGSSAELMLVSHPAVTEVIEKAQASRIFGDCSGITAFTAEHQAGAFGVGLQRDPAALSDVDPVIFTVEDARLSRTLLLTGLNIQLHDVSVDEVIAVIQSAGATAERSDSAAVPLLAVAIGDRQERTLGDVLEHLRSNVVELVEHSGKNVTFETPSNWCCEIHRIGRFLTAADVLSDAGASKPLYGLLYGDEGWEFVPDQHAARELDRFWGSRDYVAVLAQERSVVVLNLDERRVRDRTRGEQIVRELAGLTMPQLRLARSSVPIAGIDHGVLFAFQRSLLRLLAARELEARLFGASRSVARPRGIGARLLGGLRSLGGIPALFRVLYRGPESRFYKDLLRVSGGSVAEIAELQSFVDGRVGATPLLQRLSRAADLVDIELRDRRLTALNWLVVLLTFLTIAIGVLEIVLN
jgi:hypothetical protein